MGSPFDAESTDESVTELIPPLWTVKNLEDPEKMLEWQNNAYSVELKRITKYREMALKHIALFRGRFYADTPGGPRYAEASQAGLGISPAKVSKLIVNHLYDLVIQRVARITKNKPAVAINPANSEYYDRISAKVVKYWVDYQLYRTDFDRLMAECAQATYIMGEAYIGTFWDADAGDNHPDWAEEENAAEREKRPPRLELVDDSGKQIMSEEGEPLFVEKPVKTGDIEFRLMTPLDTIVEYCGDFHKANYFFHEKYVDINELKAKYKNLAEKIEADTGKDSIDRWREIAGVPGRLPGKILVRYFYHKGTPFLASGRFVVSTTTVVLENKPLPPKQAGLPLVRLTDIDVPGEQRGLSFFIQGKNINATINDLASMARRNAILLAHPKWMIPRGSVVKKDALGNDITMIEYLGPVPPKLEAPPAMSQEINILRADLKQDLQLILGVSDISRGVIPPNVRSALAMQQLEDADTQRANTTIVKYGNLIRDTVRTALNIAQSYYKPNDKRLIPIVGKDNRYLLKEFKPEDLAKGYDVRVEDSSGMPNSKAAKVEMLVELRKTFGEKFIRDEQAADLLEFGNAEKFFDSATVAVKAAEAENESIMGNEKGKEGIEDPASYENHAVHWNIHMREIQNRGFKTSTPPEVQAAMVLHIMATEMMMLNTARKNPAYSLELIKLPQFPAFYDLSHEDRMLMDRARSGNPLTLIEIEALYNAQQPPPGAGMVPPAGGVPNMSADTGNAPALPPMEGAPPEGAPSEAPPEAPPGPPQQ